MATAAQVLAGQGMPHTPSQAAQDAPTTVQVTGAQPQPEPRTSSPDVSAQVQPTTPQTISLPNIASPSHGSMWRNILMGALAGMAAGQNARNGAGFLGGAGLGAGAAIQGQQQQQAFAQAQQAQKQRMAQAQVDAFDRHSQYAANAQLTQMRLAQLHSQLQQSGITLADEGAANLNAMGSALQSGGQEIGHGTETELISSTPDGAKGVSNGTIRFFPDYKNPGQFYAFRVTPEWLHQTNTSQVTVRIPQSVDPKTGKLGYQTVTIPPGGIQNGDYLNLLTHTTANGIASQTKIAQSNITAAAGEKNAQTKANATVKAAGIRAMKGNSGAGVNDPAQDASLVDEIGTGHIAPERLSYLLTRNPQLLTQVAQKYPGFDSSKAAAYPQVYKDYTSTKAGTAGGTLIAGATAIQHLSELREMNTPTSHVYGTPAYTAYKNKVDTLSTELARFYGDTTIPAIEAIKSTLMSTLPGNRDAAIRTQAQSMADRLTNYQQAWLNAAPSQAYEAPMPSISAQTLSRLHALDPNFSAGPVPRVTAPPHGVFSSSVWLKANPGGNIQAAQQAARNAGYQVVR